MCSKIIKPPATVTGLSVSGHRLSVILYHSCDDLYLPHENWRQEGGSCASRAFTGGLMIKLNSAHLGGLEPVSKSEEHVCDEASGRHSREGGNPVSLLSDSLT
jgi:hypothetical protein